MEDSGPDSDRNSARLGVTSYQTKIFPPNLYLASKLSAP